MRDVNRPETVTTTDATPYHSSSIASRTYRAEAIVLKPIDFGETDRIITLLTRHFGKVSVVAKGIRKPTSRLAGHAEPLTHATYSLARGRNLDVLTGAESRTLYRELREDLNGIAAGWYVAELADRFSVERSASVHRSPRSSIGISARSCSTCSTATSTRRASSTSSRGSRIRLPRPHDRSATAGAVRQDRVPRQAARIRVPVERDLRRRGLDVGLRAARCRAQEQREARGGSS